MKSASKLRRLEREYLKVDMTVRMLDAGRMDDLFVDAATKAALRGDLHEERVRLLRLRMRADPRFEELADGRFQLSNLVILYE